VQVGAVQHTVVELTNPAQPGLLLGQIHTPPLGG
jgi:hypothetical protein